MDSPLEPEWVHLSYDLAFRYLDDQHLSDEEILDLHSIVESHCLVDGFSVPSFPGFPTSAERIMHEGWKAGTSTWVFMGRNVQNAHIIKGRWVAVSRSLPKDLFDLLDQEDICDTLWIAYNLDFPFSASHDSEKCIGPTMFYDDLKEAVFLI